MTTLLLLTALWLLPAILGYIIASWSSRDWSVGEKDLVLLIPLVNIVVLGLVLVIELDEWLTKFRTTNFTN